MKTRRVMLLLAIGGLLLAGFGGGLIGTAAGALDTAWTRTYGGAANDGLRSVCGTTDGCFAAVGYTYSVGPNEVNIYVLKVDADGDTLWTRALGGAGRDYGYAVCQGPGGGCYVAGYTTSSGLGREDVYVASIDADGDVVWERTYGGAGSDEGRTIFRTSDGHLVVAGREDSFGSGQSDMYVLKLDAQGDTVWTRVFGGVQYDWGESACETADGGYCISGTSSSNGVSRDIYLVKIDPAGSLVWQRFYGDFSSVVSHDWGGAVCAAADGGLAVGGNRIILVTDPDDIYFLRTDSLGTQTSLKRYSADFIEYGCSMCETPDAGYLICGAEKNESTLKNDLLIVKRMPGTGWSWEQVMGGAGSDWGSCIIQTDPGQYLVAGHTECSGAGGHDGWLVMLREPDAAVAPTGATGVRAVSSPNPFATSATIRFGLFSASQVEVTIYDFAGRSVRVVGRGWREPGDQAVEWDGRDESGSKVAPGIYLVRIAAGESSRTSKLVRLSD
ncbi:MAG: FlgD immunoglobulin-like domain containing protein [bacterium]